MLSLSKFLFQKSVYQTGTW